jgi:hypothetical protein
MHPVDEEMKGNKKRRVVMRRQQSFAVRAKRIILPIIALGIGIFVLLTRTIGSAPQDDKRRQFVHLRGGNNKDLVWVHSDSQPFVSGTCLIIISFEGLATTYCGYSYACLTYYILSSNLKYESHIISMQLYDALLDSKLTMNAQTHLYNHHTHLYNINNLQNAE